MAETVKIKLEVDGKNGKREVKEFQFSLESLESAYKEIRTELRKTNNESQRLVEVMQDVDGELIRVKISAKEVASAMQQIRADRLAKQLEALKKSGQALNELGEKITGLGTRITGAFTVPIVGAFAMAISQSKELQEALKPIQDAFAGVAGELGTALVPIVKELTPALIGMAGALSDAVRWFTELEPGSQKAVLGVVAFTAAVGPAIMVVGQLIQTLGMLKIVMAGLGMGGALGGGAAAGAGGAAAGGAAAGLGGLSLGATGGMFAGGAALAASPALIGKYLGQKLGTWQWASGMLSKAAAGGAAVFGGPEAGVGAYNAVAGMTGGQTLIYNNYGIDANNPHLKIALAPYINSNARDRGQR